MSVPVVCSACGKRDASYFRVGRVAADGTETPLTTTCSVRCLISWAVQYAQLQGARLVYGVKQEIDRIKSFFRPGL